MIVVLVLMPKTIKGYEEGFKKQLIEYSLEINIKEQIDSTQIEFKCCGSTNYTDWFPVPFFKEENHASVPYSCCNISTIEPCRFSPVPSDILTTDYNFPIYSRGCTDRFSKRTSTIRLVLFWLVIIAALLPIFLVVLVRALESGFYQKYILNERKPKCFFLPNE